MAKIEENTPMSLDDAASALGGILDEADTAEVEEEQTDNEAETDEDEDEDDGDVEGEDAGDDDPEEEASDDDGEEAEDDEPEEDEGPKVHEWETKAGEKIRVDEAELYAGYMRNRDYTQKTQEVAEQRRETEALREQVSELRQQLEDNLTQWALPTEHQPDWVTLAQQMEPKDFAIAQAQWQQQQALAEQAKQAIRELREQQTAEESAEKQKKVAEGKKRLQDKIPEFRDPEKAATLVRELMETGSAYGFSDSELSGLDDPRVIEVLVDAHKYRQMQKKPAKLKRVSKPEKTLRPGAKTTAKQHASDRMKKAQRRFAQTKSLADAAAMFDGVDIFG